MSQNKDEMVKFVEDVLKRRDFFANPYFKGLEDGSLSLDEFQRSQEQFYFAVAFFSKPMAALVARIPDPARRLSILQNIVEEHGDFKKKEFHANTFTTFLERLGVDSSQLEQLYCWPQIRIFNSTLTSSCLLDELETGVACMGIIEYSFARVSSIIANAVIKNQWLKEEEMIHYDFHEVHDIRHADDFFEVILEDWENSKRRYYIKQGFEMGAALFYQLYEGLYYYGKNPERISRFMEV